MSFDCTTNKYEVLYARWLQKPNELLRFALYTPQESLLDLCGGTGIVAKEALLMGTREVTLFDLNPRTNHLRINCITGNVNNGGLRRIERQFDLVVCRQALGYLDLNRLAEDIPKLLNDKGRFAFNTFIKPKWGVQTYRYEGHRYLEASGYIGSHVFHLQAGPGVDVTSFRWYSADEIETAFAGTMVLDRWNRTDKTLRMVYRKKPL